jgi:hypothetical protein
VGIIPSFQCLNIIIIANIFVDPGLQEISVKVESFAESHGILGRLVGEHAKDIYSKKVIPRREQSYRAG